MKQLSKRIFTSIILLLVIYLSFNNIIIFISFLTLINFFVIYEFNSIFNKIFKNNFFKFVFIILILIFMTNFSLLLFLNMYSGDEIFTFSLIFLIIICSTTDMGGYIFGNIIGGKKITKISPNKTYSGVIGSFVLSMISGYIFYFFFSDMLFFKINIFFLILLISLISQLGDLFISFLKRKANVKDTGYILPGHGGILDRIDGILFSIPLGIVLIS